MNPWSSFLLNIAGVLMLIGIALVFASITLLGPNGLLYARAKALSTESSVENDLPPESDTQKNTDLELKILKRVALRIAAAYLLCPLIAWFLPAGGAVLKGVGFVAGIILIGGFFCSLPWSKLSSIPKITKPAAESRAETLSQVLNAWPNNVRCDRIGDPQLAALLIGTFIAGQLLWIPDHIGHLGLLLKLSHFTVCFDSVNSLAAVLALLLPLSGLLVPTFIGRRISLRWMRCSILNKRHQGLRGFLTFDYPFTSALLTFFICCFLVGYYPSGLGDNIASWLASCLEDAMPTSPPIKPIFGATLPTVHGAMASPWPGGYASFAGLVHLLITAILILGLLPRALRASAGFANFAHRLSVAPDAAGLRDICVSKPKRTTYFIKDAVPWLRNISRTFWWLVVCWAILFCLVAFCPGKLGLAIVNWLAASAIDASIKIDPLHSEQFRIFLASVVALYGAAPLAITASVFLPSRKLPELIMDTNGIFVPEGFLTTTHFRPYRRWNDVMRVDVTARKSADWRRRTIKITFHTGGSLNFRASQLEPEQLSGILGLVDEFAERCAFTDRALEYLEELNKTIRAEKYADRRTEGTFRSTIFEPFAAGNRLRAGEIRIIRLLSSRPCAATYLVRTVSNSLAILKQFVVPKDTEKNDRLQKQFQREYRILSSVNHPQICKVLDVFDEGGNNYLLLQYVKGRDLRKMVEEDGPRSEQHVIAWAKQMSEIMLHLHSQQPQVLHRDLTPDNLIRADDGLIKLVDFGAAHHFMEGVTGTLIGKQCYMSPEQLRGRATARSDIYSLGATLYFLVMGKDPRALAQSSPKDEGAAISAQLNELITRCTAFDENQRPQSFQEILTTLGERTSMPAEFVIAKNVVQILASEVSEKKKTQSESQETDTKDPGDTAEELGSVISLHVREREQIEVKSQS